MAALVALGAVVLQLAPEAVGEIGWVALTVLGAGALLPFGLTALVRWAATRFRRPSLPDGALGDNAALGLELAYVGLLVHQLGDGLALGALGSHTHDHGHEVSLAAIGIHAVALSAVFVLAFRDQRGWHHALLRAGGMAAVLCGGALFAGVLPAAFLHTAHPWIAAATAGLLLHVAAHPLVDALTAQPAHAPR